MGLAPCVPTFFSLVVIATASGFDGPWTPTPTSFNNAYFTLLLNLKWIPKEWDGPFQYVDASTGKLMMLPTDLVLLGKCTRMRRNDLFGLGRREFILGVGNLSTPFFRFFSARRFL
jgi:hypothetical protein